MRTTINWDRSCQKPMGDLVNAGADRGAQGAPTRHRSHGAWRLSMKRLSSISILFAMTSVAFPSYGQQSDLSVLEESLKQLKPGRCPTTGWAARSSSADLSLIRGWPISGRPTPALPGSLMKSFGIWTPALVLAVDMDQFCSSVHATV